MRKLVPTHVVFEGKVGALTGKNALQAKVGETVLIVHSQANRDSRPHLIGGHGDYVWRRANSTTRRKRTLRLVHSRWKRGSSSLHLPSAGHLRLPQSHAVEAVELGALAHFKVEGQWNDDLMKQVRRHNRLLQLKGPAKNRIDL